VNHDTVHAQNLKSKEQVSKVRVSGIPMKPINEGDIALTPRNAQDKLSQAVQDPFTPTLSSEEIEKLFFSSLTSSKAHDDLLGAKEEELTEFLEQHGTTLMYFYLSLQMRQKSDQMLSFLFNHKDALFGDGACLLDHASQMHPSQKAVLTREIAKWEDGKPLLYPHPWASHLTGT
jgi:hypothetical protein